jgi:hydrogenase expression/formation protein HypC
MCLGVPGRVLSIEGLFARVDFWGEARDVRLDIVDGPVAPGDHVLSHGGFAIRRIPAEELDETLALYDRLLVELDREDRAEAEGRPGLERFHAGIRGSGEG